MFKRVSTFDCLGTYTQIHAAFFSDLSFYMITNNNTIHTYNKTKHPLLHHIVASL
jgi:hypothetical protein